MPLNSFSVDATQTQAQQTRDGEFTKLVQAAAAARDSHHADEAVKLYREGLEIQPGWNEGWWLLGSTLSELNRYSEARDAFHHFLALQPSNGQGWALMGLCEFELGNYRLSLEHLQKAEQLGIRETLSLASVVRYHEALLLIHSSQFEEAMKQLASFTGDENRDLVQAEGLCTLRMHLLPKDIPAQKADLVMKAGQASWAFNNKHDERTSQKLYEELASSYPNEPNVHYAVGTYLLDSDPDRALQEFKKELAISPSHVDARLQIVFLYIKQGDAESGLSLAQQAVKLDPKSFVAHDALGRVFLEMGEAAKAIPELEAAVHLAPDSPQMHFNLSEAYKKNGNEAAAAREMAVFQRLDRERKRRQFTEPLKARSNG